MGLYVLFKIIAAFAAFGAVGHLRRWPQDGVPLSAFVVGSPMLPETVLQMPGANTWATSIFLTLVVLGFNSAFVMLDVVVAALICDPSMVKGWAWGKGQSQDDE
jgi:solute carrier family 6 GABA transporter-like protein 1